MQFLKFSVQFIWKSLLAIVVCASVSCSSNKDTSNKVFNEKYGEEVKKMTVGREAPVADKLDAKLNFTGPIEQDFSRYTNSNVGPVPEYYSTQQFANQPPADGYRFPEEMFENNYSSKIDSPFRKIGAEFDVIEVPTQDAYGVKAGMSDKEYLLVSRKLLQKNVDSINAQRTEEDVENSETLIAEQGRLKKKAKMLKIFGKESVEEDVKDVEVKKSDNKVKSGAKKNKVSADQKSATSTVPAVPTPPSIPQ